MSIVSQNSMRNTYIKEDTLGYYQQPVKFDQDSGQLDYLNWPNASRTTALFVEKWRKNWANR